AESAAAAGLHGAAAVPLRDAGRFVGVLELFTRAVRPMSEQGRRALVRAGSSLGRLIERRKLEVLIERKGREWSLTFDALELPIFITRLDGTITRVNRAARDLAGAGEFLDVLNRNIAVAQGEPWTTLTDIVAAVRDSRTPCTAHSTAGARTWDVSASWYWSESESDDRAIVVMRDTTDLVRLQESVRRGEQLAALGELVAGVAHEVRNPIFGMGLTVDALQAMLPNQPEFAELAGVLRVWLDRLNRLMENLLEYGKTWSLDLSRGALDVVLSGAVERCRQISPHVTIEAEVESNLTMLMDANRLGHAFENLITNAVQHSKPDQEVVVTARRDGAEIACTIRDFGPGFEVVDLPRIFQPFFTRRRGGTGLGLSIVQRIVDEHGGTIGAGNAADGGAIVTMRFPVHP
ncbi:MAG TPA: ATP-binding protein, partial [Thermoanaerobaculia bacterium]|nr:ATP-binding protein [Thermoanaerobaculia bacterium]